MFRFPRIVARWTIRLELIRLEPVGVPRTVLRPSLSISDAPAHTSVLAARLRPRISAYPGAPWCPCQIGTKGGVTKGGVTNSVNSAQIRPISRKCSKNQWTYTPVYSQRIRPISRKSSQFRTSCANCVCFREFWAYTPVYYTPVCAIPRWCATPRPRRRRSAAVHKSGH